MSYGKWAHAVQSLQPYCTPSHKWKLCPMEHLIFMCLDVHVLSNHISPSPLGRHESFQLPESAPSTFAHIIFSLTTCPYSFGVGEVFLSNHVLGVPGWHSG